MMQLCAECFRHVRSLPCPFCGCETARGAPLPGPSAVRVGMRRGALLLGLAGAAAEGCGGDVDKPDVVTAMDAYGLPPDAADVMSPDVVTAMDVYGIPPDAADVMSPDVVTAMDAYGIPPDAPSPDGSVPTDAAVYGIPPDSF